VFETTVQESPVTPLMLKERDYEYFNRIRRDLLADESKRGRYVVVRDEQLHGDFESFSDAYRAGLKKFQDESFLVQPVVEDDVASVALTPR